MFYDGFCVCTCHRLKASWPGSRLFFSHAMAAPEDDAAVKRRRLADATAELKSNLEVVRQAERTFAKAEWSRRRAWTRGWAKSPFVALGLLLEYGVAEDSVTGASKLMLPKHTWGADNKPSTWNRAVEMRRRLEAPRIKDKLDVAWANRFAPQHRRVIRKVKRLMAELKVFQQVMATNERWVTPKQEQLIIGLKKFGCIQT